VEVKMMNRTGVGKALIFFTLAWFLFWFILNSYSRGAAEVGLIAIPLLIPGLACWISGRRKLNEIKRRLSLIEDSIRRAKSRLIERGFEEKILTMLDSAKNEISNIYLKPKYGGIANKYLANIEDAAKELENISGNKSIKNVKYQMSILNDRLADLRSEFRR